MSSKSPIESDEGASEITTSGVEYEVFLSFRGPDTRSGITDHVYVRLTDAGIRVFRDDEELRKGEKIGPGLLKAIRESKIAIPIFSKDYAASKWCLKELAQIVECKRFNGLKVMPIFYDVTPSEVRNQTGDYAKAFESHEKCYDEDTTKSWKTALREVGELIGWDLHSGFFKKEGELVKEVTKMVLRELKKAYLIVTDYIVGVGDHTKTILEMLSADIRGIKILGIYGMGGIGKTTLAKVVYNHLSPDFEKHSFLADIRETHRSKGMEFLCKRLITDILGEESAKISNVDEGIRIIRERFSTKKVVILLDDVDEISQLKALVGKRDWFGRGSRIIITTRNKSILDSFQVDSSYELGGLKDHLALQLFSNHAFRKDNPPKELLSFSQKAVRIAAGLPLALEVFGSLLCGKSSEVWDSILKKLEIVSHEGVRRKLKISYEALDVHEKQIFLDIVCFFIGEDYRLVVYFWEESEFPKAAMEVLQQMSLIKIQRDEKIWMHDQLRDLGREILREEHREPGSITEATGLSMRNMADKNIQRIDLYMDEQRGRQFFSSYKFANLPNLKFLRVNYGYTPRDSSVIQKVKNFGVILEDCLRQKGHPFIFSELRWLSLDSYQDVPMRFARNMNFQKLAILSLPQSNVESSWSGWSHIKMAENLKVLNLTACRQLVKTPDLSCHLFLEQLILEECSGLVEIDKSISVLQRLVLINLKSCRRLKKLPGELSCMESLEELDISYSGIVEIPSWPLMRRLRVFHSSRCLHLEKVGSLDFAVNLTELSWEDSSITVLPYSIGKLVNLQKLSLKGCTRIETIPESIGDLGSLVELDLCGSRIIELPNTIGNLRNLKTLNIGYSPLKSKAIRMMENVERIEAPQRLNLRNIPNLPQSLISLKVSTARMLKILDLSGLICLENLEVQSCPDLVEITGRLESLIRLKLKDCPSLEKFADIPDPDTMEFLSVEGCGKLNIKFH